MNKNSKISLMPVSTLFSKSWDLFKASATKLLLVNILSFVVTLLLIFIAVLPLIFTVVGTILAKSQKFNVSDFFSLPVTSYIIFGVTFIGVLLLLIIINSALQIASILIVGNGGNDGIKQYFKNSFSYIVPLLATGVLVFFLEFGAFFLFLLPLLIFYFLLVFVNYEVILGGKRGASAIEGAVNIVMANPLPVLGRIILITLAYIVINGILPNMLNDALSETKLAATFISFIINTVFGWYALCYSVILYKDAKLTYGDREGKNIRWMWILAGIGWILFVLFAFFAISYLPKMWDIYNTNNRINNQNNYTAPDDNTEPGLDYSEPEEELLYDLPNDLPTN